MAAEALVTQLNDRGVGACPPRHTVGQTYNNNFFYKCEENQLRGKGRRHASVLEPKFVYKIELQMQGFRQLFWSR